MSTTEEVQNNLTFVDGLDANVVAYTIGNSPNGEISESLYVVYNANKESVKVTLPEGNWNVYVNGEKAGTESIDTVSGEIEVSGISAMVLAKGTTSSAQTSASSIISSANIVIIMMIVVVLFLAVAITVVVVRKHKTSKK